MERPPQAERTAWADWADPVGGLREHNAQLMGGDSVPALSLPSPGLQAGAALAVGVTESGRAPAAEQLRSLFPQAGLVTPFSQDDRAQLCEAKRGISRGQVSLGVRPDLASPPFLTQWAALRPAWVLSSCL